MTINTTQTSPDIARGHIIERPDGFYWQDSDGLEYGPFATLTEAEADMESAGAADDGEILEPPEEAERETGMADWLDPETGEPGSQFVPRIEDH